MSTFFECSNYSRFVLFCFMFLLCFVLFCLFFSCSSQPVLQFRPLFLLLFFCVFCLFVCLFFLFCFIFFLVVSLAPFSQSSSYILSKLHPLTKNNAFPFIYFQYHCLASLGRFFFSFFLFFQITTPSVLQQSGFCFFCFVLYCFFFVKKQKKTKNKNRNKTLQNKTIPPQSISTIY